MQWARSTADNINQLRKLRCAIGPMVVQRSIWEVTLDEDVEGLALCLDGGVCVDERSDVGECWRVRV